MNKRLAALMDNVGYAHYMYNHNTKFRNSVKLDEKRANNKARQFLKENN